jgi:hypothetical protein
LGFMDGSLTIAVAVRPPSLVYCWPRHYDLRRSCAKCPRHVVGLAGMVVGEIVDGCGILAATVGGSSLKSCVPHRWPNRHYLRVSCDRNRWPVVGLCGEARRQDRWRLRHSCGNLR